MKFVLTSAGISNQSIEKELREFIGKDFKNLKMLFCTTASNFEGGDMSDWLVKDLEKFEKLGFKIDVCDINGIGIDNFLTRFEWSDVFYFEGGNTSWLRNCIKTSGLEKHLNRLLENKIWIGASAGSCVLCPTIVNSCQDLFDEESHGLPSAGLGFVNFQFIPHLNNQWFPKVRKDNLLIASKKLQEMDGKKLYILDDNGAIFVEDGKLKVISEGEWFEI